MNIFYMNDLITLFVRRFFICIMITAYNVDGKNQEK